MVELDSLFDQLDQEEATLAQETPTRSEASAATEQPKEKYTKSTLFVRGVPKDATNEELEDFFSNIGPVRSCFVVADNSTTAPDSNDASVDTGDSEKSKKDDVAEKPVATKNRGFGYVQFVLAEDATRAIGELAEVKFRDGRKLMLDFAMKKGVQDQERPKGGSAASRGHPRPKPSAKTKDQKPQRIAGKKLESRTIIVSGIAKGATKHQLIKKVKKSGVPHSVVYPAPFDGATEEQLQDGAGGTAFITYETHGMAQKAVKALNNHIYKGAKISAKIKPEYLDKNARLIVRNLPFKLRENDLEHLFSQCGTVLEVTLPRKFTGGPLRGFAFVQMGDYASAENAVAKWDKHEMHGRTISVAFAIAKDRFVELEETGEIEKPEFKHDADADVSMKSDGDDDDDSDSDDDSDDDNGDVDMENSDDFEDADSDGDKDEKVVDEALQGGCTLFIRNLSFESDEDGIFDLFKSFGKLRYCRIVYDPETGRSRGTAFVCFWNPADSAKCLDEAKKAQELSGKLTSVPSAKLSDQRNKSVLLQEAPAGIDSTSRFVLDGRMLSIALAVDREKAHDLATEGAKARKGKDKRSAYLLKEGIIFPDTPAAAMMAPADLEHHIKEYSVRKNQILKNPNLYISKTRLTVHNIPRSVDDSDLRKAAIAAIGKFKQEVKDKVRQPLSKDEMEEGWDKVARIVQVKIVRSKDRVDGSSGKARSMGYGFIEFNTHAHALACLRYLNFRNSKQSFSKQLIDDEEQNDNANKSAHQISRRSLRVMFAIENAQVVKKRDLRFALKDKRNNSRAENNSASGDVANGGGAKRKRDGGGERFQHGKKPAKKSRPDQGKTARFGSSKPFGRGKTGGARPGKSKR